jgi:RecB family exonuclease
MFSQELSGIVRQHVSEVLARYRQDASSWELEYLALEEQRLCQLIDALLQYESRRAAFVVEQMECKQEIEIAGLRLSVRMDRIDKLEHGRILIDYKTGEAVQKQWMGERPDEPQLPLYAVAGKVDELRDVYFARVRRSKKDPCFIGALSGDDCGVLRSTNETYERDSDFERLLDQWRVRLEALSLEFQAGVAAVSPKDGAKTCKHCPFSGLCRVAETSTEFHNDDDDAESEPS